MIGTCRNCRRVLSYDEVRCPFCGTDRPVDFPWEVQRRPPPSRWPTGLRRWAAVALVSLALVVAIGLCAPDPSPGSTAGPAAGAHP